MRRILSIVAVLLVLTTIGTVGLRFIEEATWLDSLYMIVITLTTVGYADPIGLSDPGKVFIIGFLTFSVGIFAYSAFQMGQWIVSAEFQTMWRVRRVQKSIEKLNEHYIVCGMGRMGKTICEYLHARGRPFVVIDNDQDETVPACEAKDWLYIVGDATHDDVLLAAGIARSRALAAVLATDADNIYVVLSARLLNADVQIIVRASEEEATQKMERAGATRVVSPFSTGGMKMARFMLAPRVEDFLEIADTQGTDFELADVQIREESPYVGKKLVETDLREKGVMIIGIRRANGERLMPPPDTAVIESGDCLFAFGSADSVNQMIGEDLSSD